MEHMRREKDQYKLIEINPELSGGVSCMDSQFWFSSHLWNDWHKECTVISV